jgi:chromosome segregation ATPase
MGQINELQERMRTVLADKRKVEGELLHASTRLMEARQEVVEIKTQLETSPHQHNPEESEARARLLGENNRVLILELEERRQMLNSSKKQLTGSEQARMQLGHENTELRAHLDRSEHLVQELQYQIGARTRTASGLSDMRHRGSSTQYR